MYRTSMRKGPTLKVMWKTTDTSALTGTSGLTWWPPVMEEMYRSPDGLTHDFWRSRKDSVREARCSADGTLKATGEGG